MTERAGFVAVAGVTSAGKSSLVNAFVGEKVAIVSGKPQSTRRNLNAILTEGDPKKGDLSQVILVDTPGFHAPKNALGEYMIQAIGEAIKGADRILFCAEAAETPEFPEQAASLFKSGKPVDLALTKFDLAPKLKLSKLKIPPELPFAKIVLTSTLSGAGLVHLKNHLLESMPVGPLLYPADDLTDTTARFVVEEFVREVVCHHTRDEVPFGVAVKVETFDESKPGEARVEAIVYCERESHKGILIGENGAMIRKVGEEARGIIAGSLGVKVHLLLKVKVRKDWRSNPTFVRWFGYKKEK